MKIESLLLSIARICVYGSHLRKNNTEYEIQNIWQDGCPDQAGNTFTASVARYLNTMTT